ncbi:hypothetical protein B0J11DRAFT_576511 [Dendryphion nanum]|uniref:Uncharacterized protein n=1 Tax=Dendryphion nanum TaxID=256645 RepID=A0A9P9EG42_9PLEO|nr:hypothetical protein B0J11DRAFT_576511 [Dendryphion nanum]
MSTHPLAQSADRASLWKRLGHVKDMDYWHKHMLAEASAGRDRLSNDPSNLAPHLQGNPNIRAPYRWDEISETEKHREILRIVHTAEKGPKYFYDKGKYFDTVEENWVVRWFLWHSFRYRDNRDRTITPLSHEAGGCSREMFDPVYDGYRPHG